MQSKEKKYFNIMLSEDAIITFDTNIAQSSTLLKVIATANATTINILTEATGREDIAEMLVQATLVALDDIQKNEGGEADESN